MPGPYPEEPRVGVGSLVIRENKILLIKRKYPPAKGKWSIPGGHLELGESVLEAAARELQEETGLKGKPLGVVNVDDYIMFDKIGRVKYHYTLVTVLLDAPKGEPHPGGDALDARFVPLDNALRMDLSPSTRGLILKIMEGLVSPEKVLFVRKYVIHEERS